MEIDNLQMGIGVIQSFRSVMTFPWILDIDVCLYLYMIRFVDIKKLIQNSIRDTCHLPRNLVSRTEFMSFYHFIERVTS